MFLEESMDSYERYYWARTTKSLGSVLESRKILGILRSGLRVDSMVWHHDWLQCVSVLFGLSVTIIHAEDGSGDCLGLSGHVSLGFNDVELVELVDFEVSMAKLDVVPVESQDSRRK